jgi:hypothetical protein
MPESGNELENRGLHAEWRDARDGIRHAQRERQAFLGFAIAAQASLLGLLIHSTTKLSASGNFLIVGLACAALIGAEWLTIRSTLGILTTASYIRLFLEPQMPGVRYEGRIRSVPVNRRPRLSGGTLGLGVVYLTLTAAPPLAWFSVALHRGSIATSLLVFLTALSAALALMLSLEWPRRYWKSADTAWDEIIRAETAARTSR